MQLIVLLWNWMGHTPFCIAYFFRHHSPMFALWEGWCSHDAGKGPTGLVKWSLASGSDLASGWPFTCADHVFAITFASHTYCKKSLTHQLQCQLSEWVYVISPRNASFHIPSLPDEIGISKADFGQFILTQRPIFGLSKMGTKKCVHLVDQWAVHRWVHQKPFLLGSTIPFKPLFGCAYQLISPRKYCTHV